MTGVQPYVILLDYDEEVTTDEAKEEYTLEYYDRNIDIDNAFLYIYFAEENTDEDVGYMCYAVGVDAMSVMDDEAIEIFWNYIDRYWYSELDTDEMFAQVFEDTADSIMGASGTSGSVLRMLVIVIGAAAILLIIVYMVIGRRRRTQYDGGDVIDVDENGNVY